MDIIKGFAINRTFVDQTPGVVADIGELSARGFTFAKEPRVYSSQTYPTISFAHFPSKDSGVGFNAAIPDAQRDHILKVAAAVYTKSLSTTGIVAPGEFVDYVQTQMGSAIADVKTGASVQSGMRSVIEWIQWRNTAGTAGNVNKVWFVNNSFVGQFDEYEITVVPPFTPVSQFFGNANDVKALLAARSYQTQMEVVDQARGASSETYVWGKEYNYVNPTNANDKTLAKFSCLIYGEAGNNIDLIKEAIVNYLLANSTQTRDQWKQILPELFLRTEFLMFPQWNRMAVEHVVGGVNGIYSPIVDLTALLTRMRTDSYQYTTAHVNAYAQALTFPYMSVAVGSIGHIENRDGKFRLTDWFPDYLYANSLQADFNRMSKVTRDWVLMIAAMMPIARDMTSSSTVPMGYARVRRGNKLFVSKSYQDIQFLVASPAVP